MKNSRERNAHVLLAWLYLAVGAFGLVGGTVAAWASDPGQAEIAPRLNAAVVQTQALKTIAAENEALGSYKIAALFGESDEEKQARLQHEQAQDASVAGLRQRMDDLENSLRRLTGEVEALDHKIGELNGRIERIQKDFDYRLCTIAAQQFGASAEGGEQSPIPCAGAQASSGFSGAASPVAPSQAQGSIRLTPPPTLGGSPTPPASGAGTAALNGNPPAVASRPKYDAAMNLLAKAQYDEARSAFRAFADSYPTDELAPQAVYWIGDIAYVRKDYAGAARAFAEEIKKYPASPRAPESMLKLGQSLIAMGQKQEGCTTLGALTAKFPNASKALAARAAQERKAAGCRQKEA